MEVGDTSTDLGWRVRDAEFERKATATFMANPELMAPTATEQPSEGLVSHISLISHVPNWPRPLEKEAYYGLAGELVRAIEPHTEAWQRQVAEHGERINAYPLPTERHDG